MIPGSGSGGGSGGRAYDTFDMGPAHTQAMGKSTKLGGGFKTCFSPLPHSRVNILFRSQSYLTRTHRMCLNFCGVCILHFFIFSDFASLNLQMLAIVPFVSIDV